MRTRIAAAVFAALTVTGITAATLTIGDVSPTPRVIVQAEPPLCPSLLAMCAPTPPEPEGQHGDGWCRGSYIEACELTDEQRKVIADEYTRGFEAVR